MKFVALISGGKDSIYSIIQCIELGHELIACIHLSRPKNESEESYMYQTAGSEIIQLLVQQCLCVPLIYYQRTGLSIHTSLIYDHNDHDNNDDSTNNNNDNDSGTNSNDNNHHDEVEDLYNALLVAQKYYTFQGVCSGAILSNYQRIRIEQIVCNRLQLTSLCYLWRKNTQQNILSEMIHLYNMEIILVRTASPPGLQPKKHLYNDKNNQFITAELENYFITLNKKYQFHICGEGGEYETIVLYCPKLYNNKRIVIDESQIIIDTDDNDDGTGILYIKKCHIESIENNINDNYNVNNDNNCNNSNNNENNNQDISHVQQQLQAPLPPIITISLSAAAEAAALSASSSSSTTTTKETILKPTTKATTGRNQLSTLTTTTATTSQKEATITLPQVRLVSGGLLAVSEIMCTTTTITTTTTSTTTTTTSSTNDNNNCHDDELLSIQKEANEIFMILKQTLRFYDCTPYDVIMVHLYLSKISYFAYINLLYKDFFGVLLPPSRCCIAIGTTNNSTALPGKRNITLDCYVQCGSGQYLRNNGNCSTSNNNTNSLSTINNQYYESAIINTSSKLRTVLHVQSISYWAPVCVGPYSQVNTIRDSIHFIAGQIGLIPETMQLQPTWIKQLQQIFKNLANILDALDGNPTIQNNILSGLIYVSDSIYHNTNRFCKELLESICQHEIQTNAGVQPGIIDNNSQHVTEKVVDLYDGYEDEETMEEMNSQKKKDGGVVVNEIHHQVQPQSNSCYCCPLLVVSIPEMPVNALIEIEMIACTQKISASLRRYDYMNHFQLLKNYSNNISYNDPNDSNIKISRNVNVNTKINWDTGHDFYDNKLNIPSSEMIRTNDKTSVQTKDPLLTTDDEMLIMKPSITPISDGTNNESLGIHVHSYFRCYGTRSIGFATVTASFSNEDTNCCHLPPENSKINIDRMYIFSAMLDAMKQQPSHDKTISSSFSSNLIFDDTKILSIRLYYFVTDTTTTSSPVGVPKCLLSNNDSKGTEIRSDFYSAVQMNYGYSNNDSSNHLNNNNNNHHYVVPAVTVIPVHGIHLMTMMSSSQTGTNNHRSNDAPTVSNNNNNDNNNNNTGKSTTNDSNSNTTILYALQAFSFDPVHSETRLWIHHGR